MCRRFFYRILKTLCLLILLSNLCHAQSAKEQIAVEINRLEKLLSSLSLSDDEKNSYAKSLSEANAALDAGYVYLSLYKLQPYWIELKTREYLKTKTNIKTLEAFEEEWKQIGLELNKKEKVLKAVSNAKIPAVVLALSEASQNQVRPYHQSGRLYGINTTVENGLYYLGRSPASLDFAIFCRGLKFTDIKRQPKLRSLDRELSFLETEVPKAFSKAESDQNTQFIRTNVTLKIASELNRDAMYAGALYKYLDATFYFGLINADVSQIKDLSQLKTESERFRQMLAAGDIDHSIGQLYREMAQRGLSEISTEKPTEEELKRSLVILEKVIPSYFKYMTGEK